MKKCDVCEVLKQDLNVIFDTEFWRVSLDGGDQYYLGRSFVTAKRHVENLSGLTSDDWDDLHKVITNFETAAKKGLGAILFNWSCLTNNAFQTKPYNPHVHWHVRPRYDKVVTINKEKFSDDEFGHHYARSTNRTVPDETAKEVIKLIQQNLS